MRIFFIFLFFNVQHATSQITVSGTVLDKSKINYVEGVRVVSTSGALAFTDSLGRYKIITQKNDSLFFIYNNKPTQKFAVNSIANTEVFDISLLIPVKSKYTVLKEVVIYSKSFKEDSAENRNSYADIFSYHKPGIESSITPQGGVGLDLNEIINMFRFKRNKRLKAFQKRLEAEGQEKYISSRFSKNTVRRITQLKSPELDSFLIWYRPTYEFASESDEITFNEYVINSFYHFRKITGGKAKKAEEEGQ